MYTPASDRSDEHRAREIVAAAGIGTLFSAAGGLQATTLPLLWQGNSLIGHVARANPHWRELDGAAVLVVVTGPDAYVSPNWYPSKAEHGRTVPTWNYSEVQLRGTATLTDDPAQLESIVRELTDQHERAMPVPWRVDDAPESYVAQLLRAIVGVQISVTGVAAKEKWSRGRSQPDIDGVQDALDRTAPNAAAEMRRARGL